MVISAELLAAMSPNERAAAVRAARVDLEDLPEAVRDRIAAEAEVASERLDRSKATPPR